MKFLKSYFNTPKMPLSFYYTPYVVVYIFKFLFMVFSGNSSLFSWILNIVVFILGSYTYAWLSDYILSTKENILLRYFFSKSVIFRRDFGEVLKTAYSTSKETPVYERRIINRNANSYTYEDREKHSVYFKRTFISIIINIVAKFILAWIFIFVFWISIFTHVKVMKNYRDFVDKEIEAGNL
ncbi:hypothetical protein BUZ83_12380 [Staphylococcus saprophyticus]|uniref:hypothetical protein n=1 Tax=Staphylococcus TaxID=1279 RepID=UPI000D1F022A|nr:hypothetical protein [Staphylococcus saprophyticus]PTJ54475.1 hypothetical protein BUZ71_12530 [Staphylococcus saprophyticus]PTJ63801.1 hypothetical protein BUZ77_12500 [Staphylococcus saprophyticus]PTK14200.1 hypothetical protein BUZ78_12300 [Staphylococcus saprophyticus]RIO19417.1 hypothetical protein BUZ83_12380 [Staphylococcus saprophyticus]RIO26644.1 hypothetical protein BUZ80_12705 [Staphylococcus saprophyticus]